MVVEQQVGTYVFESCPKWMDYIGEGFIYLAYYDNSQCIGFIVYVYQLVKIYVL